MLATETKGTEPVDKKIELIQQLLAKAEGTNYPEEAKTYQEHAERLMVRYGIEMAEIDARKKGTERELIVKMHVDFSGSYAIALQQGLGSAIQAYKTTMVLSSNVGKFRRLYVVGAKSDVEQMIQLASSLQTQAQTAMKVWWKDYPLRPLMGGSDGWKTRREFILSFGFGAAERVTQIVGEEAPAGSSTDLVLVDRQSRAEEAAKEMFGGWSQSKQRMARGAREAASRGRQAGYNANIFQKEVTR